MRNAILILILVLTLVIFSVGCQPFNQAEDNKNGSGLTAESDDNETNAGNTNPENDTNNPEINTNDPENGKENASDDNLPPQNTDNTDEVTPPEDNPTEGSGENPPPNPEGGESGDNLPSEEPPEELPEIGTSVGFRFNDVTLKKMEGGTINTADLRGKIVIVNIWADWCPPCKAELPDFHRIATEYKDRVVIIAADSDSGRGTAKSYVENNFPETDIVFAYDTHYSDAYRAAGGNGYVPYTAILDENGVIVYSNSGMLTYEWLVSFIENLLG